MAGEAVLQSYLCVVVAAVCYGVMYVPIKGYRIFDGTVFQWNLCSGILFAGLVLGIVCEGDIPQGNIEGIMGGGFWAISNMAVLPLVKILGLGVGFALYHAVNLFTGYLVGRLGVFAVLGIPADAGTVPWLRDLGAVLLVLSFIIMIFVEPEEGKPATGKAVGPADAATDATETSDVEAAVEASVEAGVDMIVKGQKKKGKKKGYAMPGAKSGEPAGQVSAELIGNRADNPDTGAGGDCQSPVSKVAVAPVSEVTEDQDQLEDSQVETSQPSNVSAGYFVKLLGLLLSLFAGIFAGVNAVPFDLWRIKHPANSKGAFVFPQALGAWIVSTVIYIGNAVSKRILQKEWPPQPLIMPAFVSGCIWASGFVFMCVAIDGIGWTAAYTFDAVGPVLVASLLSVLWFKEITDRVQLRLFTFCCFVQAVGVVLIALGT